MLTYRVASTFIVVHREDKPTAALATTGAEKKAPPSSSAFASHVVFEHAQEEQLHGYTGPGGWPGAHRCEPMRLNDWRDAWGGEKKVALPMGAAP